MSQCIDVLKKPDDKDPDVFQPNKKPNTIVIIVIVGVAAAVFALVIFSGIKYFKYITDINIKNVDIGPSVDVGNVGIVGNLANVKPLPVRPKLPQLPQVPQASQVPRRKAPTLKDISPILQTSLPPVPIKALPQPPAVTPTHQAPKLPNSSSITVTDVSDEDEFFEF